MCVWKPHAILSHVYIFLGQWCKDWPKRNWKIGLTKKGLWCHCKPHQGVLKCCEPTQQQSRVSIWTLFSRCRCAVHMAHTFCHLGYHRAFWRVWIITHLDDKFRRCRGDLSQDQSDSSNEGCLRYSEYAHVPHDRFARPMSMELSTCTDGHIDVSFKRFYSQGHLMTSIRKVWIGFRTKFFLNGSSRDP